MEHVVSVSVDSTPRNKPRPTQEGLGLEHVYAASEDGTDENVLVVLHGLGDTMAPFVRMARQLKLPQTATLVVQAPERYVDVEDMASTDVFRIPYLESGYQWYTSFTPLGEVIEHPNPLKGVEALGRVLEHLGTCGWTTKQMHLFGFGQGGSVALETALRGGVGSVVSVGGGLIEVPTRKGPGAAIQVLYMGPPTEGLGKGFEGAKTETGEMRMPRGAEWGRIMEFWSGVLGRRAAEGAYAPTTTALSSPVRSSLQSGGLGIPRRSLGVIEEAPVPSAYARIVARFRRSPAEHVPRPRRTLRKRSEPPPAMHNPPTRQNLKSWWRQFKLPKDDGPLETPRVFGIPLRESLRYASVQISTADPNGDLYVWGYIPVVVAKCGLFLKENATEVEGVFRINGSNKRMRDLQAIFESPPRYGKDLNWKRESYTSHDVASVFRRYLTQMPEPVIPTEQYHSFRAALAKHPRDDQEVIHTYRKLIKDMPRANQYLLLYVLDLLSVFARKANKNLMTESNLAVIFRPGIISHPAHEMQPHEHALSQEVLVFLIQHQDHFMLDPPARGDSIMLSSGTSPGLASPAERPAHREPAYVPPADRPAYVIPSDSDEDPGVWKLVERRRDPTLLRRRSLNDPALAAVLTAEPESLGSDTPLSGELGGAKVKRSRTAPSHRGSATLDSGKRRIKKLDTLASVGSAVEAGLIDKDLLEIDRERDVPTPTSTTAVVNAVPPPEKPASS